MDYGEMVWCLRLGVGSDDVAVGDPEREQVTLMQITDLTIISS